MEVDGDLDGADFAGLEEANKFPGNTNKLRTMAVYIDLNQVRAGMVADPADYPWTGSAEAMAGKARSRRGLVHIIGQMAWPKEGKGSCSRIQGSKEQPFTQPAAWDDEAFPAIMERRVLVIFRAILGGQGARWTMEDEAVVRRGLSEKVRAKLTKVHERRLGAEVLNRRVQHFTRGVVLGSRAFSTDGLKPTAKSSKAAAGRNGRLASSRWGARRCMVFMLCATCAPDG